MESIVAIQVVGVLLAWLVAAYAIWKWGPGLRKRSVRCPEKKVRAKVLVDQREAEFGSLRVTDVTACSLFADAPLTCGKECLGRL